MAMLLVVLATVSQWLRDVAEGWRRQRAEARKRDAARRLFVVLLNEGLELEKRIVPADTYIWNPGTINDLASNPTNWYDETNGSQLTGTQIAPGQSGNTGAIVWLAGNYNGGNGNSPIEWDSSVNLSSITLKAVGMGGSSYTGQQTIDSGVTVSVSSGVGTSGTSNLKVNIAPTGSLKITGGASTWQNFDFTGGGNVNINGGSVDVGNGNYTMETSDPININFGGTVTFENTTGTAQPIVLMEQSLGNTNTYGALNVSGGTLNLWDDGYTTTFVKQNDLVWQERVNVTTSNGVLQWQGSPGITDTVDAVLNNTDGTVQLLGGGNSTTAGGTFYIEGTRTDANMADGTTSYYMAGGGLLQMSGALTLYAFSGFDQEGTSETDIKDSLPETIKVHTVGSQTDPGQVLIGAGTTLKFTPGSSSWDTLKVYADLLSLNGTLYVNVNPATGAGVQYDQILLETANEVTKFGANFSCTVNPYNGSWNDLPFGGRGWTIISADSGVTGVSVTGTEPATFTSTQQIPSGYSFDTTAWTWNAGTSWQIWLGNT